MKEKSENNKDKKAWLHMRVYAEDCKRFIDWCNLQGCDHSTAFKTAVDLLVDDDMLKVRVSKARRLILKNWCKKGGVDESVLIETSLAQTIDKIADLDK